MKSFLFFLTASLAAVVFGSGCTENIREEAASAIAKDVKHVSLPDKQGLTWFAPELMVSKYRTLFYGYNTLSYRLAATEAAGSASDGGFRVLFDAQYGGDLRHYDFAKLDESAMPRPLINQQQYAERCQFFNYMIFSCIYRDRFSLNITLSDLEKARAAGLHILLTSKKTPYESVNLPPNYIQGFLEAINDSKR